MRVRHPPLAAALCFALLLSACGGGDSDGATANPGPEATATEQAATKVAPEIEAALDSGLGEAKLAAQGVEGVDAEMDGNEAVAAVRMTGGTLDGQTVEVTLSRNGNGWKVDDFARFLEFDKAHLVEHYETETKELPENFSPQVVRCLTGAFSGSSEAEMEAMYLDQDKGLFLALGKRCLGS